MVIFPSDPQKTILLLGHIDVATPPISEISPVTGSSSQSAGHSEWGMLVTLTPVSSIPNWLIFSSLENKLHLTMGLLDPITWTHMTVGSEGTCLG